MICRIASSLEPRSLPGQLQVFAADEEFQGSIDELRIYSAARSAEQIAAEFSAGPDTLPAR